MDLIERYIPPLRSLWNETIPADGAPKGLKQAAGLSRLTSKQIWRALR